MTDPKTKPPSTQPKTVKPADEFPTNDNQPSGKKEGPCRSRTTKRNDPRQPEIIVIIFNGIPMFNNLFDKVRSCN